MTGVWERDLATDLNAIVEWGATDLITLLEPAEFEELSIVQLPCLASELRLCWHGLPIADGHAPDDRFLRPWQQLGPELANGIQQGRRVLVHCKGGLGRAGTVACLLAMETGVVESADAAIAEVRRVRPGAVETAEQEEFLRAWRVGATGWN